IQDDVIKNDAIQQTGAIIPFSAIQAVPDPATGPSSVTVSIAAQGLNPNTDIRVITRVAEVQIWPTGLQREAQPTAGVTRWQAAQGTPASGPQARYHPQSSGPAPATTPPATVLVSGPGPKVSVKNLKPGTQYRITVDEGPE